MAVACPIGMDAARRYRGIAALAGAAAADFALGSLVQLGVIDRLPDPPIRGIDSHRVMTSPAAFPLGIPDAPLAFALEAAVAGLALAGLHRPRRRRWVDRALRVAVVAGAIGVVRYAIEMVRLRRACVYCIAAGGLMLATVPLALARGEARRG
jgi:uncharacterized membrane protein